MNAINVRIANAWTSLRNDAYVHIDKMWKQESVKGKSCKIPDVAAYMLAIDYMSMIHEYLTDVYAIPTTEEEVKTLFNYTDVRDCFACKGIYIDELWETFGIPDIVDTNHDDILD